MKKNYDNQKIINIILDYVRNEYNVMNCPYTDENVIMAVIDNYHYIDYDDLFYLIKYTKKVLKYLVHMNYIKYNDYYYTTIAKIKKNVVVTIDDVNNYFESLKSTKTN